MYNHDRSVLSPENYFLSLMYYGISLLEERQYRRAEDTFTQALLAKKAVVKLKTSFASAFEICTDQFPEPEIRYKLALCLEATKQVSEAVTVLQAIPAKQRSCKVNMLLAKMLQHNRYDKNAIAPLKAVLKECPLNLEAIKGLLALGVPADDIQELISDCKSMLRFISFQVICFGFFISWIISTLFGMGWSLYKGVYSNVCMQIS